MFLFHYTSAQMELDRIVFKIILMIFVNPIQIIFVKAVLKVNINFV